MSLSICPSVYYRVYSIRSGIPIRKRPRANYTMSSLHTNCDYFGREGPCGRGCYAGRCFKHRGKTSMKPCVKCGRGTASITGYCHKNCTFKQVHTANKMKQDRDYADALNRQKRDEMGAYIDEILSWDWTAQCLTVPKTQHGVVSATCG